SRQERQELSRTHSPTRLRCEQEERTAYQEEVERRVGSNPVPAEARPEQELIEPEVLAEHVAEDGHDADGGHAACPHPGCPTHPHAALRSLVLRFKEPERSGGEQKAERGERIHGDATREDALERINVELPAREREAADQQHEPQERP